MLSLLYFISLKTKPDGPQDAELSSAVAPMGEGAYGAVWVQLKHCYREPTMKFSLPRAAAAEATGGLLCVTAVSTAGGWVCVFIPRCEGHSFT